MNLETLKEGLREKHRDIADIVFDMQGPMLYTLEQGIESAVKSGEDTALLVRGYVAAIELAAQEYRNKLGDRFHFHSYDDFIDECLEKQNLFNKKGYFLGVNPNTIHAIRIAQDFSVDLCFGFYDKIKPIITSPFFVLFYRADRSDLSTFNTLKNYRLEYGGWTKPMVQRLIDEKVAFRKDW